MTQPDHLIERAAALLRGGTRPDAAVTRPDPDAREGAGTGHPPLAGEPAATVQQATVQQTIVQQPRAPAGLRTFVPLPPVKPSLVPGLPAAPPPSPAPLPAAGVSAASAPAPLAPPQALFPAIPPDGPATVQEPAQDHPQPAPISPALIGPALISYDVLHAAGLVVAQNGRSRISEEYRIVLGRVLRALREEPDGRAAANLLMVTSAKPGEGKSFTALNLAGSIAQHTTEKVLLVDLDAKVRPLTALLKSSDEAGFYDLVADPARLIGSVVRPTAIPNLRFLPVGHRSSDAGSVMDARPITATIVRIARQYADHIVIMDAPPCLSTSDPSTVAPIVGQIVMVIEAERTQRSEVEAALDLVRVCPTITMLLNKVQLTTSHTFGAYDYYGNYS